MEVPARLLARGAAGVKHARPVCNWNAGQLEFLESTCGHWRDFGPMLDKIGHSAGRLANPSINGVAGELQCKQFEREVIELRFGEAGSRRAHLLAKPTGKT